MDKEVEDACSEGDDMFDDSSDEELGSRAPNVTLKRMRESSSEDSLTNEFPKGWRKKKTSHRRTSSSSPAGQEQEDQESQDSDIGFAGAANNLLLSSESTSRSNSDSDCGSLDGMADLLEREFLGS